MSSLNEANIVGRVGQDPRIKEFKNGNKVCNFSLATTEKWTDKQTQEPKKETEWHNICVYNSGIISVIERFVNKGDLIMVRGKLKTREYESKEGITKYITEIILGFNSTLLMLSSKRESQDGKSAPPKEASAESYDVDYSVPF